MKLIIALQFHEADKPQAMRLARLIADIEPVFRDDVDFCFVERFDCSPADSATMGYVGRKFSLSTFVTKTNWTGWPDGPNATALDLLNHSLRMVQCGQWAEADALLLLEPDCVPLDKNWIDRLKAEWRLAEAAGKFICGAWRDSGGEHGHINGCCLIRPDLASQIDLKCITPNLAWDCAIAPQLRHRWRTTGLIKNRFQSKNAAFSDLVIPDEGGRSPVLVHGFKDDSAYNIAKTSLL